MLVSFNVGYITTFCRAPNRNAVTGGLFWEGHTCAIADAVVIFIDILVNIGYLAELEYIKTSTLT